MKVARLVLEEPVGGRVRHLRIGRDDVAVVLRLLRRGQHREPAEVGAGRLVDANVGLPGREPADRVAEMANRVRLERHGAVAGNARRRQFDAPHDLLGHLHGRVADFTPLANRVAALGAGMRESAAWAMVLPASITEPMAPVEICTS